MKKIDQNTDAVATAVSTVDIPDSEREAESVIVAIDAAIDAIAALEDSQKEALVTVLNRLANRHPDYKEDSKGVYKPVKPSAHLAAVEMVCSIQGNRVTRAHSNLNRQAKAAVRLSIRTKGGSWADRTA